MLRRRHRRGPTQPQPKPSRVVPGFSRTILVVPLRTGRDHMAIRFTNWLMRPKTMRSLYQQLKLGTRLVREPRVPAMLKVIPGLAAVYLVSPVDFIPDIFPGLGQLDDLAVLVFALEMFIRLCPEEAQIYH